MTFKTEKEIIALWNGRKKYLKAYITVAAPSACKNPLRAIVNEDIKTCLDDDKWIFLLKNGGKGSFW